MFPMLQNRKKSFLLKYYLNIAVEYSLQYFFTSTDSNIKQIKKKFILKKMKHSFDECCFQMIFLLNLIRKKKKIF